ncbi:UNVERIFIED_CONTAM: hypothetical protein Slati_0651300 [Sesamum latifolium]|uniref:Uncharacterized protein n=1 Tax=Sesamum latifolium TaxID=2727402 RepID=A0AAW2Y3E5_9LAMI
MVAQGVASGDKGAPVQDQAQDKRAVASASPALTTAAAQPPDVVVPSLPVLNASSTSTTRMAMDPKLPGSPVSSSASAPTEMSATPISPVATLMECRKWMYNKNLPGRRGFVASEEPCVAHKFAKSVGLTAHRVACGDKGDPIRDQAQDQDAAESASPAPTAPAMRPSNVVVPSSPVPNVPSASATPRDAKLPMSPDSALSSSSPMETPAFPVIASSSPPTERSASQSIHVTPDSLSAQRNLTKKIGRIISDYFVGAWITYSSVPMEVRDTWFSSFQNFYTWDASCTAEMRRIFNKKASTWMTRTLYLARKKGEKLSWISNEHWAAMLLEWAGESFQMVSQKNKAICRSNIPTATPVYRGGSVSMTIYKRKLEEELGRPPTCLELFERGWKKKLETC